MVRLLHGVAALLIVLAGCSGAPGGTPTPSGHDLSVAVSNEHDASYVVRVTAVPADVEGIEVTYGNGSVRRFEVQSFDALPRTALRNATAVAATGPAGLSRELAVGPGEGIGTTIEGVPADATVVYFVLPGDEPETARGAGVVRCTPGAGTTELVVRIRPDGSLHSSVTCRDAPA
jgi:hypothetical protein